MCLRICDNARCCLGIDVNEYLAFWLILNITKISVNKYLKYAVFNFNLLLLLVLFVSYLKEVTYLGDLGHLSLVSWQYAVLLCGLVRWTRRQHSKI